MTLIPEHEIERVRSENSIEDVVRKNGTELKPHGTQDLIGRCPFHQEENPSFIVTPSKGIFHCMGCGKSGNEFQYLFASCLLQETCGAGIGPFLPLGSMPVTHGIVVDIVALSKEMALVAYAPIRVAMPALAFARFVFAIPGMRTLAMQLADVFRKDFQLLRADQGMPVVGEHAPGVDLIFIISGQGLN